MPKLNKQSDGKVAGENLTGRKVPRKAGLTDETKGKALGSRSIAPKRSVVNFAKRGR